MSYREWKGADGSLHKEWRNEAGLFHREDGPAQISYYTDGSIEWETFWMAGLPSRDLGPAQTLYNIDGKILLEHFYIKGKHLGSNKKGFWGLWEKLTEVERQAPEFLKCLTRYL